MVAALPKSKWHYSKVFEEVNIAIERGMSPWQFWELEEERRALYIAHARAISVMREYEMERSAKEADRK